MNVMNSLRFIFQHPLTQNARFAAVIRWLRWQIGSRLVPGSVIIPFVNDARLIVQPGMTGATGNIYCGLHEFEDMGLVLHALRPDDLFVDIGANVGSYTVLGGGAVGAHCISIEPIPSAFAWLQKNIAINGLNEQVQALNVGLGRDDGVLYFTEGLDTMNHVVSDSEDVANAVKVAVQTLDRVLDGVEPTLIKIDVEGFETEVMAGAKRTLASSNLLAVIMELNGSGGRYGFDENALHQQMLCYGFTTCCYHPFKRKLESLHGHRVSGGNTLYVRNLEKLSERVQTAPRFQLGIGVDV